jgi:tetratricopeptide (TPR) repeat protein
LIPVIGLVQNGGFALADRYTYVSLIGFFILVVWGAFELTRCWRHGAIALSVISLAIIVFCITMTCKQLKYWRDSETLFRHALNITKNNYCAHYYLGIALAEKGQTEAAANQIGEAIHLNFDFVVAYSNHGVLPSSLGQTDPVISRLEELLRHNSEDTVARTNLARMLAMKFSTATPSK